MSNCKECKFNDTCDKKENPPQAHACYGGGCVYFAKPGESVIMNARIKLDVPDYALKDKKN